MIDPPVRTIVVEDEPLARRALRRLISETGWLELVGEAHDGDQAVALIRDARPELVFLDVQLPGRTGIDALVRAAHDPVVIFTTAFEEYALVAFELGAIDYLRKPFGRARLTRALERAAPQLAATRCRPRRVSSETSSPPLAERLALAQQTSRRIEIIYVRERGVVLPIAVGDVQHFEADGDFVAVIAHGRRHLVYVNLSDLAARLDPRRFLRIHRSHIVNLPAIISVNALDASRVEVRLRDGSRVTASRAGTRSLRQRMSLVAKG